MNDFQKKLIDMIGRARPDGLIYSLAGCPVTLADGIAVFVCLDDKIFEKLINGQTQIKKFVTDHCLEVTDIQIRMETEGEKSARIKIEQEAQAKKDEDEKKEIAYWEAERKKELITDLIIASHLPQITMTTHRFEMFKTSKDTKEAYTMCKDYANETGANWHPFLTLCGINGTGKTHLAFAVGWHFILSRQKSVIYYQSERLFQMVKKSFGKQGGDIIKECEDANLLILDDLAAQKSSPWTDATLSALIDYRYVNQLPTVITTNAAPSDIDRRIASRICEGNIQILNTVDYRKTKSIQRANGTAEVSPRYSDTVKVKKKPKYPVSGEINQDDMAGFTDITDLECNDRNEGLESI
jgi:DNA replication protein DnaC